MELMLVLSLFQYNSCSLFVVGAISAKLMLTSSAAKHLESRVTVICVNVAFILRCGIFHVAFWVFCFTF